MKHSQRITRRRHSAKLQAQVLRDCARPRASVASVAMSHGMNANVVHKWRRLAGAAPLPVASFVPAALPATTSAAPADIRMGCVAAAVVRVEAVWLAVDTMNRLYGALKACDVGPI